MNNSTRNFTNSSNTQNSSSFKDKLRKLTTGVALAGTLMVGNPSCTSCSHEKNTDQEAKAENTVGTNEENLNDGKTVILTDVQQVNKENNESENDESEYDRAILEIELEMENEQITRDSIKLVEEIKKIDEDAKRIAKNRKKARAEMESLWASVDEEVFKSSKEVQDALDEYFQWAKEN